MTDFILNKINKFLLFLEQKLGLYFAALVIALILLFIAAIYVTPALAPMQLGRGYAKLSENPFDFSEQNNLRFRILTPLLAFCIGLRGSLYIIFPLIISLTFLSTIYFNFRKKQSPLESILITMLICFSSPILFLLHFAGYVDITSYLLIFLITIFIKKPLGWIPLLCLLIFNHDSNIFIIPFVLYLYHINTINKYKTLLYGLASVVTVLVLYYIYRNYINETSPVEYNFEMYRSNIYENLKAIFPYFTVGFFYSFKLFWIFPIVAFYYYLKEKNMQQLLLYSLIIVCALSQLIVASDTSRLIGLAFPIILFASSKVKEEWGKELFIKRTFYLIVLNFLVPQFYVGQSVMIRFYPLPSSIILKYFFGIETWVG
jgi:hypothetical protein